MPERVVTSIRGCARCHGEGHPDLTFEPLLYGVDVEDDLGPLTHWAACPTNGQPILMRFVPEGRAIEHPVDNT
jgi:hypothetical protein